MSVNSKPSSFSTGFAFPYILYKYVEDNRRKITIDFLVLGMHRSMYRPIISSDHKSLLLGVVVPAFFTDQNRLQLAHGLDDTFTEDTNKATAFQEVTATMTNHLDAETPLIGAPQVVRLGHEVEEEIDSWELQAFENDDPRFTNLVGENQHFFVLTVDLFIAGKVKKQRKVGGMRILGSPNARANQQADDGDDEAMPNAIGS